MNYNLYAGAFLGTVFVAMTLGIVSDGIFSEDAPEQQGFAIVVEEGTATAAAAPEEEALGEISPLLASADAAKGEGVFRKCGACHNDAAGAANKVGPNLWGVVNRVAASYPDFSYSAALTEYAADGAIWDYEALNRFLYKPKDYIPGTTMGFAGLSRESERADLIAYLRTTADEPAPLP